MPLGLSPRETTIAEDQFRNAPSAVIPEATGGEIAMENISAPFNAALGGVAGTYAAVRSLGSNFGALGGYDPETSSVVEQEPEAVQRKFALDSAAIANQYAPDPRKSGAGAQFVYNIGSGAVKMIGDTLVTGSPIAGAAMFGATEGINTRNEIYAATGDKETADKLAIGSALFSGVAALLPGGYGETFAARIASGAVANTTFGVLQRDMMHTGLQDAGYTDMAKQYVPLDGAAMMADGILGTIFGGVHHMFAPEITDSARAIKDAEHAERSSPGIPSDPVSRQNGLDNLDRTISSMIHGDDPPPVGDVNFVPDPKQDAAREAAMTEVTALKEEAIGKGEEVPMSFEEEMAAKRAYEARSAVDFHEMTADEIYQHAEEGQRQIREAEDRILGENADKWRRAVRRGDENTIADIESGLTDKEKATLYGTHESELPASSYDELTDYKSAITDLTTIETPAHAAVSLSRYLSELGSTQGTDPRLWTRAQQVATFALRHIRDLIAQHGWNSKEIQATALQRAASRFSDPADAAMMLKRWLKKGRESPPPENKALPAPQASKLGRTARAAEAEKEQASKLDPETQEAVLQAHAAIKDNPDLQVADENGKPVSAVEELNKSLDTLKQDDGELAKVALACAGRA